MATILATSRKAARVRMLGGTHARRYDAAARLRDYVPDLPILYPTPRHRADQETTS